MEQESKSKCATFNLKNRAQNNYYLDDFSYLTWNNVSALHRASEPPSFEQKWIPESREACFFYLLIPVFKLLNSILGSG